MLSTCSIVIEETLQIYCLCKKCKTYNVFSFSKSNDELYKDFWGDLSIKINFSTTTKKKNVIKSTKLIIKKEILLLGFDEKKRKTDSSQR